MEVGLGSIQAGLPAPANPSREGEGWWQRIGDATLNPSSQDVPSVSPQACPGTAGTARPRAGCAEGGGNCNHGGWQSPAGAALSSQELQRRRDGVSSPPPRRLQRTFSESGYQPTAEGGEQPKRVRVGDVRYSFIRRFAQTVPVKGRVRLPSPPPLAAKPLHPGHGQLPASRPRRGAFGGAALSPPPLKSPLL